MHRDVRDFASERAAGLSFCLSVPVWSLLLSVWSLSRVLVQTISDLLPVPLPLCLAVRLCLCLPVSGLIWSCLVRS